ncbi:MAG: UPF0175 family protein [Anaerolineaceae bacterium]|nr:UPF0175 family protein [Anaerolineaceae bacterium]
MVNLSIPRDILDSARMTPNQAKIELAVSLYAQGRLSIGKARELANMPIWELRQLLGSRKIEPHFNEDDLDQDVDTLTNMGLL